MALKIERVHAHVVEMRARRAVRLDAQPGVHDLARQSRHVRDRARPGARKADIGRVDAQPVHEVEQPNLVPDRRIGDRGVLQAVP